jgi:hypothetical protein
MNITYLWSMYGWMDGWMAEGKDSLFGMLFPHSYHGGAIKTYFLDVYSLIILIDLNNLILSPMWSLHICKYNLFMGYGWTDEWPRAKHPSWDFVSQHLPLGVVLKSSPLHVCCLFVLI